MVIGICIIGDTRPAARASLQQLILLVSWTSTKISSIPWSYCFVPKLLMSVHLSVGGGRITQIHQIPLLIPLAVGAIASAQDRFSRNP